MKIKGQLVKNDIV